MVTKNAFFKAITELMPLGSDYVWEMLSPIHTKFVLDWRNSSENLAMFENKERLTEENQLLFLKNHDTLDRVDLILRCQEKPIGVFSIKNLNTMPEYGSLIGDVSFRNKGIGKYAKQLFFLTWFEKLDQECLYLTNHKANATVINSNKERGYRVVGERGEFVTFEVSKTTFK